MDRDSQSPRLLLLLLLVVGFSLGTRLAGWHEAWAGERGQERSLLTLLLGDSRRLFANHFYVKADAYFHSGYYPTIFDQAMTENAMAGEAGAAAGGDDEDDHVWLAAESTDWIDRFSRHFYPSEHVHLGEGGHHDHAGETPEEHAAHAGHEDDAAEGPAGNRREIAEILPWLRLSAELDPHRVETYVTGAYFLRTKLDRPDEAEAFLREGLRANPESYAILFELGRMAEENRGQPDRARNLYRLALRRWDEQEHGKEAPDTFLLAQILGQWSQLERQAGHREEALRLLTALADIAPNPDPIRRQIEELRAAAAPRP